MNYLHPHSFLIFVLFLRDLAADGVVLVRSQTHRKENIGKFTLKHGCQFAILHWKKITRHSCFTACGKITGLSK